MGAWGLLSGRAKGQIERVRFLVSSLTVGLLLLGTASRPVLAAETGKQSSSSPSAASPDQPVIKAGEVDGWNFAALPFFSYGSDVGVTVGGALFFYSDVAGYPGEQQSASLSFSYAARGPKSLDMGWGRPRILGALELRLNLHLADDSRMPYWGEGAQLGGLPVPAGWGTPPEPYRYHDRRAFFAVILRGPIYGPLGWHVRGRYLDVSVRERGPLLASSMPPGAGGGQVLLAEAGLLYDTRDRPLATRRGLFLGASAFFSPVVSGLSEFSFHGYDGAVRLYIPLWSGATIALRGIYDRKLAGVPGREEDARSAVPFFERMLYEGYTYDEGLGSASTVRGIARYRLAGEEKMLANAQLRVNLFTLHLFGKSQEFGVSGGVDAGRAWQPGYDAVDALAFAGGLRIIWDRAVLLRVELAKARGGDQGLYVAFGEMF